ncbi:hypothetical protein ALC57_05893 [Trachymyrmex cornetzi]|uniref:DNA-directed DNA polymerase n=1 Tax=Trachymyrmex cornetzi TaxID=471704 RepID=A0A151J9T8_9HYME|nr:hypothetical protein ALC57_05893 [Trachymyrmex cornetzi]
MENHKRVERELLEQCDQVATLVECFAWLQRCDECIERLEELCRAKRPRHTRGTQIIRGGEDRATRRCKDTIGAAFRAHAVERHGSAKVNTAFNDEFATKDKRAIKSINTKNIEIYWCRHYFSTKNINNCAIRLPSEGDKWLEFGNHCNKERVPFVIYADLECVLRKTEPEEDASSYTYQQHEVFSIGYYVRLSSYRFRRDKDCIRSATRCHIREKPFAPDNTRVRDHCHLIGRYRGPAHSNCNLNYKNSFSDLYLKTDVLLLGDISENFRESCVANYGLDSAHYYTLPGFKWDAMLKHTRVRFELLIDIDMIMFIERGIRDLNQCSGRYAQLITSTCARTIHRNHRRT